MQRVHSVQSIQSAQSAQSSRAMQLYLVDGIGPFFKRAPGRRLNWSKIPFEYLEHDGEVDRQLLSEIRVEFEELCRRVSAVGFNAITLDDVAHLARWSGYDPRLQAKIEVYRAELGQLFEIAESYGLDVFLTTDVMFFVPELERELGRSVQRISEFLADVCGQLLDDFPQVAGVILRIGESDGVDVSGDFLSRLSVKTPRQLRRLVSRLLPVFQLRHRLLIVRTWSVGAYHIGDLIWNRHTFDATFGDLESPSLVLSMKYGETDFFRFLPLNRHFFRSAHKKIIELQARREYEGFGEYPSFIGWDTERYRDQLAGASNMIGVSIWCQTGGWTKFRRRAFLERSAFWIELNAEVALDVMRGASVGEAVRSFCGRRRADGSADRSADADGSLDDVENRATHLLELLRLSDDVICELLYVDELAQQKLFFRRLRVPPLLSVYWDNILVNHGMRKLLRVLVVDGQSKIRQGRAALGKIEEMIDLAPDAGAPIEDLVFQYHTFRLLAEARRYYFEEFDETICRQLEQLRDRYRRKYDRHYEVHLDFRPLRVKSVQIQRLLHLIVRRQRGYRRLDRLLTLRLLSLVYPLLRPFSKKLVPEFARESAMGVDTLFR